MHYSSIPDMSFLIAIYDSICLIPCPSLAGGNKYHPEQYTCAGHKSTDPALPGGYSLPYTSAIEAIADTDGDGTISNWEFLVAIDPNNMDGNDYVFDNFEWSHCS